MDLNRAQEIFQSKDKIDVQMNGTPVWIEGIDVQSGTVRVYPEGNPEDKQTVDVKELMELQ